MATVVVGPESVSPKVAESLGGLRVPERGQPSLAAGDELGAAEAEDAGIAEGPQRCPDTGRPARGPRRRPASVRARSARSWSDSISAGRPKTWTAAMPTVRGVIIRRASSTSMQ